MKRVRDSVTIKKKEIISKEEARLMRILVAEDEKDLNRLVSSRLKAEHYSVDSCFDGQEALDYLAGAPYDAVILDIMMPVMDGLSVLRQLRQKGSQVPVLLLSPPERYRRRSAGWMIWKSIWIPIRCFVQGVRSNFPAKNLRFCVI